MASRLAGPLAFALIVLVSLQALTAHALVVRQDGIVLATAANDSLPTNWTYIGCYNESGQTRTLSGGGFDDSKNMTGAACAAYCSNKNFVYAGTEYGDECYCGNMIGAPSALQNDTKCNMGCSGNSSEACGAGNFLTVYYANKAAPKGPSTNPGPANWTSYGCWQDSGNPRTLAHGMATPGGASNMTVALCTTACGNAGYTLAGMEYAQECYCDNYLSKNALNASSDDCNMPCNGNASEFCGAGNRLNLYASGTVTPGPKPPSKAATLPINWISQGCYSDSVQSRSLSHGMNVPGGSNNMTNANCAAACLNAGYTLAGTEYAGECYCDNNFENNAAPVTDGRCNMACNGNSNDICGGPNGLTVLAFNGWYDQGCWTDSVNGRTLQSGQGVPGGSQNMTVENCVAACGKAGYTLAGVEYAGECYCDNKAQNGGGPAPDGSTGCNMACNGNSDEMCGGPNRLNVYSYNNKNLPSTTSSTSSGQTTPTTPAQGGGDNNNNNGNPSNGTTSSTTSATPTPKPSSAVNASSILPFQYQGCYTDTSSNGRSLTHQLPDNQTLTVESCIAGCNASGYSIAGMQYGVQCFCDNYIHNSPQLVDDSQCNMACGGSSGEMCGSGGHNSIYSNGNTTAFASPEPLTTGLPGNWSYVGCLADPQGAPQRTLPYMMTFEKNNSNTACMELCGQFGYNAAGTEYGEQCFCGDPQNVIDAGAQMLPNSSCNIRCTNDTAGSNGGEICGGGNALSYYVWSGTPLNSWEFATGDAAGAYEFLIGGVVIPLVTSPARNGKVTYLEKFGTGPPNSTGAYELDLASMDNFTAAWRPMHVKTDIFCSASLTLPDRAGRQINVGGWSHPSTEGIRLYWPDGSPGVPGTNDWEENVDELALLSGRWYPSAMMMANGSILVVGGEEGSNGAPVPSLELLPQTGNELYCDYLEETDPYNLYPFLAVCPSGNIFVGFYNQAKLLDPVSLQPSQDLPKIPGAVNNADSGRTYPLEGTAVILPQRAPYSDPMEILICGGSNPGAAIALDNCVTIAPDTPGANWTLERMPSKRVMPNMAALPDGTYLIANGAHQGTAGFGLATDPNLNAVLYDPTKPLGQRMTVMANTTVARLYHSELVLLDDARVLVSGSDPEDGTNPQEYRNEVFVPPYLMGNPSRPAFNVTNLDWGYGESNTLSIDAPGAGGPYAVSMMGAVSSTHGNSMGQRTFFPATSCSGSSCTVTAPPDANTCPPGWFQVFLLDGSGVPSSAIWVRVGGDPGQLGNWPDYPDFSLPGMGPVERLF